MDLNAAFIALKTAGDVARSMARADAAVAVAEFKLKFAQIADELLSAREAVAEAKEEMRSLRGRIAELEALQIVSTEVFEHGDVVYRDDGQRAPTGPYCIRCWSADRRLMPLVYGGKKHRQCPQCHTEVYVRDKPPEPRVSAAAP